MSHPLIASPGGSWFEMDAHYPLTQAIRRHGQTGVGPVCAKVSAATQTVIDTIIADEVDEYFEGNPWRL